MSFTTVPTVNNGDSWSAAQHNTYIRDNFAAVWPFTTAGDLAYASASNALARLGIGSSGKLLKSNGSAPAWGDLDFASVYRSSTMTANSGVASEIFWNAETVDAPGWHDNVTANGRITVNATGYYLVSVFLQYSTSGGSGNYIDTLALRLNGSEIMYDRRLQEVSAVAKLFAVTFPIYAASATNYFQIYLTQESGQTATIAANSRMSVLRVG